MGYTIIYRPRFMKPGKWFAWVRRDGYRTLHWWPVSEAEAMQWYDEFKARYDKRWPGHRVFYGGW